MFTIAIDPHDSNVIYAGSTGQGAFKSTDAGASWKHINADTNVNAILVDPDDGNIVYVGSDRHGVLKSTNGGRSFVRIGSPRVPSILSLAISGQTLYAGTATQGVSESIDGGRTWKNSEVSSGLGIALSVDSQGSVYVGTNFDGAFVRSVSDSHWRRLGGICSSAAPARTGTRSPSTRAITSMCCSQRTAVVSWQPRMGVGTGTMAVRKG